MAEKKQLKGWLANYRAEMRFCVRVTTAGLLAFALSHALNLTAGYWSVITAIIVMQASVGGSLKMGFEWLAGTVGGAVYGIAVTTLVPHGDTLALSIALAVALGPLALLAAFHPSARIAPITASIVLLSSANLQVAPVTAAIDRVMQVGLGSVVGVVVSLLVLPTRAQVLAVEATAVVLESLAQLLHVLVNALRDGADPATFIPYHERAYDGIDRLDHLVTEAQRERMSRVNTEPDAQPLPRTLRRLHNDLILIARAAHEPLPATINAPLMPALERMGEVIASFFFDAGDALRAKRKSHGLAAYDAALKDYSAAMEALRAGGHTRALPSDDVARVFAIGLSFEQMRQHLDDLANRVAEFSGKKR